MTRVQLIRSISKLGHQGRSLHLRLQPRASDAGVLVQLLHLLLQTREHLPAEEEGEEGARAAPTGACAKEERAPFNFAAGSIWL